MANKEITRMLIAGGIASAIAPSMATAVDFNITGFVREEIALSITNQGNDVNDWENQFNSRFVPNFGVGFGGSTALSTAKGKAAAVPGFAPAFNPVPLADGTNQFGNERTGDVPFNLFNTRAEVEIQAKFNENVAAYTRIRAYYDGTANFADDNVQLEKSFVTDTGFGKHRGNLLEWQNNDMMIDLPSAYVDINFGKAWLRVGQQQIAWGEALFFRVFDVANGLDVRRHLFLDVAAEEYADERIASPGVRGSYTFSNGWEVDAFVQKFSPTLFPNTNTPYNLIASGFTLDNSRLNTGRPFDKAENDFNFGARLMMPDLFIKRLTVGLMAVNRTNPDGVVRWDDAPHVKQDGTPNPFCAGPNNQTGSLTPMADGSCGSFFIPDRAGTASGQEWFTLAGISRLDPVQGVATSLSEAPASAGLRGLFGVKDLANGQFDFTRDHAGLLAAMNTLDAFFNGNSLRGYITREYKRENVFGASFNYIIEATPGDLLDQLIVRGEVSVTPNKKFTQLSLSRHFDEHTEVLSSVILEKYQSVFESIPATYFVFEWMHRTNSDLLGRPLSGNSTTGSLLNEALGAATDAHNLAPGQVSKLTTTGRPGGQDSSDYLTFAFQQPFPNLIWRFDFAVLADVQGGLFLQPGVRFKPSTQWQFDFYANIAEDVGPVNNDALETFDHLDEIFARISYFF